MCNVSPKGITENQMEQLVEMSVHFYQDEVTHVYQDPDFPDNVVFTSERGDNYNTIGWYQACFELILPKVIEGDDSLNLAFAADTLLNKNHPVDLLYSPFLAIKYDTTNKGREEPVSSSTESEA